MEPGGPEDLKSKKAKILNKGCARSLSLCAYRSLVCSEPRSHGRTGIRKTGMRIPCLWIVGTQINKRSSLSSRLRAFEVNVRLSAATCDSRSVQPNRSSTCTQVDRQLYHGITCRLSTKSQVKHQWVLYLHAWYERVDIF